MMQYINKSIQRYIRNLSQKTPVPGGGSAAALAGACGAALISMVVQYSKGKSKSKLIEKRLTATLRKSEKIRKRLTTLVDLDAEAYLKVVATRKASAKVKKAALKKAQAVPLEICHLCYSAVQLTPFLVKRGNKNLVCDVQVAIELLNAAFQSALINVKINQ